MSGNSSPLHSPRYHSSGRYATRTGVTPLNFGREASFGREGSFGREREGMGREGREREGREREGREREGMGREGRETAEEYVSEKPTTSQFTYRHETYTSPKYFGTGSRSTFPQPDFGSYPTRPSFRASSEEISDEDEYVTLEDGRTYILRARKTKQHRCKPERRPFEDLPTDSSRFQNFTYDMAGNPFIFVDSQPQQYYPPAHQYDTPRRSRARAGTTSTPKTRRQHSPSRPTTSSAKKSTPIPVVTPIATARDAARWKIPAGYSLKNWDPTETPILLLGSVFDANSLGKWIYDWTVYRHGPASPISDVSGDLWLLLIKVAGKVRRSDEVLDGVVGERGRIRRAENRELIDDFLKSGQAAMDTFKKLLKQCEGPMLKAEKRRAKKEGGESKGLGKNAGVEFVECLFGRDGLLEGTEKWMAGARLWNLRWDANCEEILMNPTL